MAELITLETLAPILEDLRLAHHFRIAEKDLAGTVRIWSRTLAGLHADAVRTAADRQIQTGERFPHVKEIRELALEVMSRTNATVARIAHNDDPDACIVCGATYQYHEVKRKRVEIVDLPLGRREYREILDEKGAPIWETVISPRAEMIHDRAKHGVT